MIDDSSGQRLEWAIRSIDPGDFAEFVGACWVETGLSVDHLRDGGAETDLLVVSEEDGTRRLARVYEDRRIIDADGVSEVLDAVDDREGVDGALLVTAGELGDSLELDSSTPVELLGVEAFADLIRRAELFDQVVEFAPLDPSGADGLEATFGDEPDPGVDARAVADDGRRATDDESDVAPGDFEEGVPAVFNEVMWRVGPGPVASMDDDEKDEHVSGVVEHALGGSVTERRMKTPPNDEFSLSPADYLQVREHPVFLFEEFRRGVRLESRGIEEAPSDDGSTVHLVTNERVLSITAREDDEFTLNVPLSEVEAAESWPGLFDGAIVLNLTSDTCHLPVHHGLGSDVVESAATYVERGPHPWGGNHVSRGTINNPATFGDSVDLG